MLHLWLSPSGPAGHLPRKTGEVNQRRCVFEIGSRVRLEIDPAAMVRVE